VFVVVVIPIMVAVPAAAVDIPPSFVLSPAVLPCFMEFMTPIIGLPAVVSMMLDGFVELVVHPCSPEATAGIVCGRVRSANEDKHTGQQGQME
jgi:hypothetical protein